MISLHRRLLRKLFLSRSMMLMRDHMQHSILRDESMHDRLAPGTGAKDTAGFVKMIKDAGVDPKVVGVEVISDEILGRGLKEAAAYTYENTEKVLKEAWPEMVD